MQTSQKNAKQLLLTAKDSVSKVASEIQKMAQDMDSNGGGTLGPDQVKEILSGVSENLGQVMSTIANVAENVPASGGSNNDNNMGNEDESSEDEGDNTMTGKGELGLESPYEKGGKDKKASQEMDKLREQVASLMSANEMAAKEKLASEFASYFPLSVRKAKFDEFIGSKEPMQILQAKLEGIKSVSVQTRQASRMDLTKINPHNAKIFHEDSAQRNASMSAMTVQDLSDI